MKLFLNKREIVDAECEHGLEDSVDSYFSSACFNDSGEELTDAQLDLLTDNNREYLDQDWFECQISRAESIYEGDR